MGALWKRFGLVVASAVIGGGLGLVGAPAAVADTVAPAATIRSSVSLAHPCVPEHRGPNWRWHATDRRFSDHGRVRNDRGHWDHLVRQWDRHDHRWEKRWMHLRYDDRYCQQRDRHDRDFR